MMGPELSGKELAILKEAIPQASRVSVLQNPANADAEVARGISPKLTLLARMVEEVEGVARKLGIQLQVLSARSPEEFDGAFTTMIRGRSDALLVLADSMFFFHRTRLADLAAKAHLPTMFNGAEYVEAGGLMSYSTNYFHLWRRTAVYVDKILKGAKPADLPVEQPTTFQLVINLKTATALGLTIPQSLLLRADEVIQ
jgi:putative ABC transport system substrate-binding protein